MSQLHVQSTGKTVEFSGNIPADLQTVVAAMFKVYGAFDSQGFDKRVWFSDTVLGSMMTNNVMATYRIAKERFLDDMFSLLAQTSLLDEKREQVVMDFIGAVREAQVPFIATDTIEAL